VSTVSVALGLAYRQVQILLKNPSLFVPPMLFPLMNFLAFAGGLSRLRHVPGFDYAGGYTAFQFVFVLLQSAAFGGVFTGFGIARDFEGGFGRRLLVTAPRRSGILFGYAMGALFRWVSVAVLLTIVAVAARMQIAFRFRTVQAGPLMQTPVFMALFLAPVYVPLDLLRGWIHAVASANPITFVLVAGRSLLAGDPEDVLLGFAIALASAGALATWARLGLRRAERAG
jgi:ABC-2 type transport system permease protein